EYAFAHTRPGKNAHALAFATGEQAIESAHAEIEGFSNAFFAQWIKRFSIERIRDPNRDRTLGIHRPPQAVQDAALKRQRRIHSPLVSPIDDETGGMHPAHVTQRHEQHMLALKSDYFGLDRGGRQAWIDVTHIPNRCERAAAFNNQASDLLHRALGG